MAPLQMKARKTGLFKVNIYTAGGAAADESRQNGPLPARLAAQKKEPGTGS